jgi:hypothetical protein
MRCAHQGFALVIIVLLANFVPRNHVRVGSRNQEVKDPGTLCPRWPTAAVVRAALLLDMCLRKTATHCATTATTGEWATLIWRLPVSAKPIMVTAPMNVQIAMNWLLRSLIT